MCFHCIHPPYVPLWLLLALRQVGAVYLHGPSAIQQQIKEAETLLAEMPDAVFHVIKINHPVLLW